MVAIATPCVAQAEATRVEAARPCSRCRSAGVVAGRVSSSDAACGRSARFGARNGGSHRP